MSLAHAFAHFAHQNPNLASFLIFMTSYHLSSFVFHLLDTRFPTLRPYKKYHSLPKSPSYHQMMARVLLNQFFILLPSMLLATHLGITYTTIYSPSPSTLPSVLAFVALAPLLHEVPFYLSHRFILHSSWGFRSLNHALHHSSVTHSALSAMYMSGPDFLLEIVVPYLVPLSVLSKYNLCNTATCIAILPVGAFGGLYEHSGYNFFEGIAALDTKVHAMHHRFYNCSFADGVGAPSVLDPMMGTACTGGPPIKAIRRWLGFEDVERVKKITSEMALDGDRKLNDSRREECSAHSG